MQAPPTPARAAHPCQRGGRMVAYATSRAGIACRAVSSHAIVWKERTSTRPRSHACPRAGTPQPR